MRLRPVIAVPRILRRSFVATNPKYARDPAPPNASTNPAEDDFYALLLKDPTPNAAQVTLNRPSITEDGPPTAPPLSAETLPPRNQISFSTPLAGPSARMRGISRGEKGLDRPPEPDNCCMSGCVNCVWDAYREEVEEWAAALKRRDAELAHGQKADKKDVHTPRDVRSRPGGSDLGDEDGVGGMGGFAGIDLDAESGLFEGVPVGIREFMRQEKMIRERRENRERQSG